MTDAGLWSKLLTETSPFVVFVVLFVRALAKLGELYISKHFEKMAPIYERGVAAIERLSHTAERYAERIDRKLEMIDASQEALWEEMKTPDSPGAAPRRGQGTVA